MTHKTQNRLIVGITLLLAAGVYGWFFPLNKGILELQTGIAGYEALVDGKVLPCSADPCATRLNAGLHDVFIKKEKHATVSQTVLIRRGITETLKIDLKRVYTLEPSSGPGIRALPLRPLLKSLQAQAWAWNAAETRLLFLDTVDERLKILEADGQFKVITALKNIQEPLTLAWSRSEAMAAAYQKRDLYLIDIVAGARRKKILDFEPTAVRWSPASDVLLLNDTKNNLYKLHNIYDVLPAPVALNLALSAWQNDTTLLYFTTDPKTRRTDIKTYEPATDRVVILTVKFDFLATRLVFDSTKQTAYVQGDDGEWYELRL